MIIETKYHYIQGDAEELHWRRIADKEPEVAGGHSRVMLGWSPSRCASPVHFTPGSAFRWTWAEGGGNNPPTHWMPFPLDPPESYLLR